MTLTKADIIDLVHEEVGLQRKAAADAVEKLIGIIKGSLIDGEDVLVSGFGKFCVKEKAARRGRNPATGDEMILPRRRVITFRCSTALRKKING